MWEKQIRFLEKLIKVSPISEGVVYFLRKLRKCQKPQANKKSDNINTYGLKLSKANVRRQDKSKEFG
jgi:hypothetical protein